MRSFVKSFVVPGSLGWLVLMFLLSALLMTSKGSLRRFGGFLLATVLAFYAVLSLPAVACRLTDHLAVYGPLQQPAAVSAIVLLDGDNQSGRIEETLRLYRWLQPRWVVVSGSVSLWRVLVMRGVPPARLLVDATSETTREQVLHVAALLRAHDIDASILVASEIQMPRALAAFRAVGLDLLPSASAIAWRGPCRGPLAWRPARAALHASAQAMYEYVAQWYYRWRGWLEAPQGRSAERTNAARGRSPDER